MLKLFVVFLSEFHYLNLQPPKYQNVITPNVNKSKHHLFDFPTFDIFKIQVSNFQPFIFPKLLTQI